MEKTLGEIADLIGGKVAGDSAILITGFNGLQHAAEGDLSFISDKKYLAVLKESKASAVLVPEGVDVPSGISSIICARPSVAFSKIIMEFSKGLLGAADGIHPQSIVEEGVELGEGVAIGPGAVIRRGAVIGNRTIIGGNCYVGPKAVIGDDCILHPLVMVADRMRIGNRVILQSGAVIGSDGFGYDQVDGKHVKIPQIGIVEIQDDVEIGANTTIDRARLNKTVIGAGSKIDNLVQIAHNVEVGKNCILISQSGMAGSSKIEDGVIMAGQSACVGHATVGRGTIVGARGVVTKDLPSGVHVMGFPARDHKIYREQQYQVKKLPKTVETVRELRERIEKLEAKIQEIGFKSS